MRGSRNFRQGGGGVQVSLTKKALTTFFFFFLVLSSFYRSQMVNFKETFQFSSFQRGSNIFQGGGVQHFPGGVQLFPGGPIAYITCDFPGGVRIPCPPPPPLWIRTCITAGIHKRLNRIGNREDPDQTASSEAV